MTIPSDYRIDTVADLIAYINRYYDTYSSIHPQNLRDTQGIPLPPLLIRHPDEYYIFNDTDPLFRVTNSALLSNPRCQAIVNATIDQRIRQIASQRTILSGRLSRRAEPVPEDVSGYGGNKKKIKSKRHHKRGRRTRRRTKRRVVKNRI